MAYVRTTVTRNAPRLAVGTYLGDAGLTQAIVGLGFRPRWIMIWAEVDNQASNPFTKSDQDGAETLFFNRGTGDWVYLDDTIISLDEDGFTVGDSTGHGLGNVANAAINYNYIALG